VALFIANGLNLSIVLARMFDVSPFAVAGALFLVLVVLLVLVTFVRNRRWPQPAVNLDTSELRAGTKVVPLARIDRAALGVTPLKKSRVVILRITAGKEARAEVVLRDRKDRTLDVATPLVLGEALRRTTSKCRYLKTTRRAASRVTTFPGILRARRLSPWRSRHQQRTSHSPSLLKEPNSRIRKLTSRDNTPSPAARAVRDPASRQRSGKPFASSASSRTSG
jgi:hypothetical protein